MTSQTVQILLVEDNPIDAEAIRRAFCEARIANVFTTARDGSEALNILRGHGVEKIKQPYLILLDLNMPGMNGFEFLSQIRADEELKSCVVFVLTSSDDDRDKSAAYNQQVAGYMVKSEAGKDFLKLIKLLDHYWRIVEFPPGH